MNRGFDQLDRRILFELDCDSRQSVSSLARKVKQGRDRVEYRLSNLLKERVIRKCYASVNMYKLGLALYKTYLRLENNKPRVSEFITYLRKHPRVYWVALFDGSWDLAFVIMAQNDREFYDIHSQILSQFNSVVLNFTAYPIVEYKIQRRNYLTKSTPGHTSVGGVPAHHPIDQIDFNLLKALAENARLSAQELSDRADCTPAQIRYRIEALEKAGIITGYHVDLDLAALGMQFFKAQLYFRNYELALRKKFLEFCENHPNVTYYIEQIGDCNVEIELEVPSYAEYSRVIDEIRGEYSKLIRNFNTVMIRESWYTFMPSEIARVLAG